MIILHHAWQSSASRRVRLCLEEKNLEYEGHVVDLGKLEQHSDAYKKINPLGVVPCLVHNGRPVHESGTKSGWLVGGNCSIADIAAVPLVKRIEEEIAPDEVQPDNTLALPIGGLPSRHARDHAYALIRDEQRTVQRASFHRPHAGLHKEIP